MHHIPCFIIIAILSIALIVVCLRKKGVARTKTVYLSAPPKPRPSGSMLNDTAAKKLSAVGWKV